MSIRCGKCRGTHESVQQVRNCYGQPNTNQTTRIHANRFAGSCQTRHGKVDVGAGRIEKVDGNWKVFHLDGQCPAKPAAREPYPNVPAGHYAVESLTGHNDLDFFRVDRPEDGPYKGRTFVKRVIGGRPSVPVRGQTAIAALKAILAAGIDKATLRYGQEIGRCGKCNRHLTDETSRARGIGPDCWAAGYGH